MGNSPSSSSSLQPPTLVASDASSSRREADADLFEEFSTSTTFGEVTIHSTRSTITNLTMSSRESAVISYEEELRDEDDTHSSSTKTDSLMYQRRRQRLMSRGETSSRKLTSSDTHPFFSDALIELQDGGVAFNPQFGLDYTGEEGTRTASTHRRHRRRRRAQNPNEAVDIDTATSRPQADASTESTNNAVDETEDQQEENEEADADTDDQITTEEEQDQDEGVDKDEDLGGNLGELKFVYPLASSLRATPAAFESIRQENNRRPRQNSFSAMGA